MTDTPSISAPVHSCERCGFEVPAEPLELHRDGEVAVFCDTCPDGGVLNLYGDLGSYLKRKHPADFAERAAAWLVACPCGGRFVAGPPRCPGCREPLSDPRLIPGRFFLEIPFQEELGDRLGDVAADAKLYDDPARSGLGFCAIRLLLRIAPEQAVASLRQLFDAYPAPTAETALDEEEAEEEGLDTLSCLRTVLADLASDKAEVGRIPALPHPYETFIILGLMHLVQDHGRARALDWFCEAFASPSNESNDYAVHLLGEADVMLVEMMKMYRSKPAERYLPDEKSARAIWDRLHSVH